MQWLFWILSVSWAIHAQEKTYYFNSASPFELSQEKPLDTKPCCQLRSPSRDVSSVVLPSTSKQSPRKPVLLSKKIHVYGKLRVPRVNFSRVEKPRLDIVTNKSSERAAPTYDLDLIDRY